MADNRGVFGLSGYYDKDVSGDIPGKGRESFREYGYFGGGAIPGPTRLTTVDRIDYSNDTTTASVRGPLASVVYRTASIGNSNFGYFGGGVSVRSSVTRSDYSNDTATASVRGPLSLERFDFSATGNSNFGYFGGGRVPGINYSTVDRIDYSNDAATASVRGPLSLGRGYVAATGNVNFGYYVGLPLSTTNRITYSNDTAVSLVRGPLSLLRGAAAATGNSNFGYFGGGGVPGTFSTIDRIDYSNDTAAASVRGPLSSARYQFAATGNSNFGYFGGGFPITSTVDRIDYTNDTATASVRGPLSVSSRGKSATSSASFGGSPISQYGVFAKPFGYFGGGRNPFLSTIDRIDYSTDTSTASVRGPLSVGRYGLVATGNSPFGYFGGGTNSTPALVSTVDRIDYNNDTANVLVRGPLSFSTFRHSSSGNNNFGYFMGGGGVNGAQLSTVSRINYSNDSATASTRGSLSEAKTAGAGTGNFNFGYFVGGIIVPGPNTYVTTINRIDYSNDNATTATRGPLDAARTYMTATGNQNFGYVFGGRIPGSPTAVKLSSIVRIDYASDTSTASVRGNLTGIYFRNGSTSNSNFGYSAGDGDPGQFSIMNRIDYSNDTATATIRGPLSAARYELAGVSATAFGGATDFTPTSTFFDIQSMRRIEDTTNASVKKRALGSFGYFGGGSVTGGTTLSTVDRTDYSNDTATASVRGPLSLSRRSTGGVGNSNFGYHGGGFIPSPLSYSTVDRIDYSNDSSNTLSRTSLLASGYHSGFGNQLYGYFAASQGLTKISRIDFSNDTSILLRNIMRRSAYYRAATGNNNYGYIQEGLNTSVSPIVTTSLVERVQYSNDTQKTLIRGPLSIARRSSGATGNSNFGYYAAGANSNIPATYSTIDRVDYSNDTATASVRGPLLSVARGINEGTGNSNFGYFSGFAFDNTGSGSGVNRINYSNDTATASARGPLSSTRYVAGATTNARNS